MKKNIDWKYDKNGNYWCGSCPYFDGVFNFIYTIYHDNRGIWFAEACNNAFGATRIAVVGKNNKRKKYTKTAGEMMHMIENDKIWWLYTGYINDENLDKITKEEF